MRRLEVRELEDGRRTCWGPMADVLEKELGFVRPRAEDGVTGREVVLPVPVPVVSGEGVLLREAARARGVVEGGEDLLEVTWSWSDMSVK